MSGFINDFKDFAMRGNVFDLAVGIIIGVAFGKIVESFVNDLLMPIVSLVMGKINLAELKVILVPAAGETPELAISYGMFINTLVDFIFIALVVFWMVKLISKLKKSEEESAPPEPSGEEKLLGEIRDLLSK